ncbi:MAG TPA: RnfABCDGE type electron transport complex subunit D [Opitutus sp.]|nr:RnfABCDGE type electron transport complex subunit D [Opitutus sp.]
MSTALETAPASPLPPGTRPPSRRRRFFDVNNRFLPPILITCILLSGQLAYGMLESWSRTLLAIFTCIATELILSRATLGKWPHLASAYISGISVGILVRSPFFWPFALCGALTIMSKYVLRWRGQHLWNPSNFGLSVVFFLYPAAAASLSIQWGNNLWPMIVVWILGALIIGRLKRFHICLTYVASFLLLSWVRSLITGNPWSSSVAPLTGPMYQLFIFFMITDPRTTVNSRWGQCVVAALVAVAEMLFRLNQEVHAPYYALFLVGPAAKTIELAFGRTLKKEAC